MVLYDDGDAVLCVGQASHSWVSGRLARRWGNDRFARPEPFEDVCLGAEQHDVGMAEWDLAPALNPDTGRPRSFMELPLATHLALWSAAPRKVLTASPYAALLVSMHGRALYARDDARDGGAVSRFVAEQGAFQQALLEQLGEDPARARHNQMLVWAVDFLSLAPLTGWLPGRVPAPTRPGEPPAELTIEAAGDRRVTVDPWPFDLDELAAGYRARRLEGRFATEPELHAALDRAPWIDLTVTWSST